MRLLLDTHIFLLYITGDTRLSTSVQQMIRDPAHVVYLSVVSVWEVIVKHQLGKLALPKPPRSTYPSSDIDIGSKVSSLRKRV
jgi:PIN domain nuclease of toxin-antitoxin system